MKKGKKRRKAEWRRKRGGIPEDAEFSWFEKPAMYSPTGRLLLPVHKTFLAPYEAIQQPKKMLQVRDARCMVMLEVRKCSFTKPRAELLLNLCYARYGGIE